MTKPLKRKIIVREPTGSAVVRMPKFDGIFADAITILSAELKRLKHQVESGRGLTAIEARQFNGYLTNIFKVLEDKRKTEEHLRNMSDKEIEQLATLYLQGKGVLPATSSETHVAPEDGDVETPPSNYANLQTNGGENDRE